MIFLNSFKNTIKRVCFETIKLSPFTTKCKNNLLRIYESTGPNIQGGICRWDQWVEKSFARAWGDRKKLFCSFGIRPVAWIPPPNKYPLANNSRLHRQHCYALDYIPITLEHQFSIPSGLFIPLPLANIFGIRSNRGFSFWCSGYRAVDFS